MTLVNIMPMAGKGKRFLIKKYKLPKPYIRINHLPMFILSNLCMPKAEKNIFLYLKSHDKYFKKNVGKLSSLQNVCPIEVNKISNGQATTCLLAKDYINDNDKIFVHSCDSYIKFNKKLFNKLLNSNDILIFTTKPNEFHLMNQNSFGWVNIIDDSINKITCKKVASNDPKNDKIIIGTFAFKNKEIFINSIKNIIKNKIKVNDEYYLDMAVSEALKKNIKISIVEVDKYYSWGTPSEMEKFKKNTKL